jgi:hypothetical protein
MKYREREKNEKYRKKIKTGITLSQKEELTDNCREKIPEDIADSFSKLMKNYRFRET